MSTLETRHNEIVAALFGRPVTDDLSDLAHSVVVEEARAARKEAIRLVMIANCLAKTIGPDGVKKWLASIDELIEKAKAKT